MRPIQFLFVMSVFVSATGSSQSVTSNSALSHCTQQESLYFNCLVEGGNKVASVCGTHSGSDNHRIKQIQYRFGAIGQIEFRYPTSGGRALDLVHFESQGTRDGSTQDYFLWFRNGRWIYEVYYREEFGNCSETGCSDEKAGQAAFVSVWRGAEAWRTGHIESGRRFRCTNPESNAAFKELEGKGLFHPESKNRIFSD